MWVLGFFHPREWITYHFRLSRVFRDTVSFPYSFQCIMHRIYMLSFVCAVRSEGGSECRQASASPNGVFDSAIGMEARGKSPEAKIERSPTPTHSVTPTEDTGSTDGGADHSD